MNPLRELDWYHPPEPRRRVGLAGAVAVVALWWAPILGAPVAEAAEATGSLVSDRAAMYFFDRLLGELSLVTWFINVLAMVIILKIGAQPLGYLIDKLSLAAVRVIEAIRGKKP